MRRQQQANKLTDTRFRFQTKQTPYLKFQTGVPATTTTTTTILGYISRQTNEITENCRLLKTFALLFSTYYFFSPFLAAAAFGAKNKEFNLVGRALMWTGSLNAAIPSNAHKLRAIHGLETNCEVMPNERFDGMRQWKSSIRSKMTVFSNCFTFISPWHFAGDKQKKKKSRNEKRKTCWPVAVTSVHQKWNERFIPDSHDEIVRCVAVVATAMAQKTRRPIKMPSSFGWDPSEFGRSCILC